MRKIVYHWNSTSLFKFCIKDRHLEEFKHIVFRMDLDKHDLPSNQSYYSTSILIFIGILEANEHTIKT